ncbi:potassium-transporting ATPase subunit KdpA [Agrococcus sp. Marseille-P2731]|uniref:potassium-transporting ATPase subunit KdpA n=1 Tax=Agrococcus sp. Marseille-P2731 TaxID=1841862 RepID=UPI0009319442|nr:potassium-transporting ATPase subunit KdpA [Agrococcus sp. Marseille-P2731]
MPADLLPGLAQAAALVAVLALLWRPVGDGMARAFTSPHDLTIERGAYRLLGVDPEREQSWQSYAKSVLAVSLVGVLVVYGLQRLQAFLPLSLGTPAVPELLAANTAVSFVTNTNWQSYSPEVTMGHLVQLGGLAVQNFVSAAVGIAVAVALVRGLSRRRAATIGSFWVDLVRICTRILLPLAAIVAVVLVIGGTVQTLAPFGSATSLTGQQVTVPLGPVASQEAIKILGTNGGGFFNANSAHPLENPTAWTSLVQTVLMLLIPVALTRTFGTMVGDRRQGLAILGAMAAIFIASLTILSVVESAGHGTAPELAGGAMEGKEVRFGVLGTTLFGTVSTATSTGAVNGMHDSFTAFGGLLPMLNMMLGEVAPGGVGSGLYGMLVLAIIAVFLSGLLVGRSPEYLGKRIGPREMKLASLMILVTPTLVLAGTALSFAIPAVRASVEGESLWNPGLHGLSEVLYAFTSAANNNGSAFAGLTASTPWFTVALGVAMLLGRFVPIVLVLALAGSFARQGAAPATVGTLPTHRPLFVGLLVGVTVIVTALTYFPILTLGPIAEGLL